MATKRRANGSKPEVFILESLRFSDEKHNRYEGRILSDMLRLSGKEPEYFYFRTVKELPHLLNLFEKSRYRYLHLSCHGSSTSVATTLNSMSYQQFARNLSGRLANRRLFCSACELGNKRFARAVSAENPGLRSIVAPDCKIHFDVAAAMWAAFYVSAFAKDDTRITKRDMGERLEGLVKLFGIRVLVAEYSKENGDWTHTRLGASPQRA